MKKDAVALRAEALEFLRKHTAGVIATAGHDNAPHAAAVYYTGDDAFNLYFLTKRSSRKFGAIQAHPQVAFVVGTMDVPQTLQIEGVASEVTDRATIDKFGAILMEGASAARDIPFAKMDDGEMALIWIEPRWIRWGDFSVPGLGNDTLFTEIPVGQ